MDLGGVVMAMDTGGGGAPELGLLGSRLLKHGRGNVVVGEEQEWRVAKLPRSGEAVVSEAIKVAPFLLGSSSGHGGGGEHMLSFSSSSSAPASAAVAAAALGTLPLYYGSPASCSGLSSVGLNTSMHGAMARVRGPFTPSQWMELEHQALIYKYLAANSPIPHSLLIPIRRSLTSPYSPAYFGSSTLGWGSFQLGYSGNADPEPGRCRRTDGKKWRCSRDAVADQKYCERHMNRGRHRSRKHVEGQPGHAAKVMPAAAAAAAAAQPSAPAASGGGSTSSLTIAQQQPMKNYGVSSVDPCSLQYNRTLMNKEKVSEQVQDSDNLSMLTSINLRNMGTLFPVSKQHNPFEVTSSRSDFGLGSSDSLMNSPQNSLENNFLTSPNLNEHQSAHSLQHFIDWPRTRAQGSALAWPDVEDLQTQRTQLSISIPMASSDLSSASTSPIHEKLILSPLKLSREYSPVGLSIAANRDEASQGEANWMPMFRESSMGGPLGEVLTKNSNTETKNCLSASLNLLTDGWDSSPRIESSPTGVLQKTAFGSVSSSTGSSPRPESHNAYEGIGNLRDDLGSILVNHPSIRLM